MSSKIDLKEIGTEYLLFIPPWQKDRAKSIEGRQWDPERKCWVYPKTGRAYDALIAEFGEDLVSISITRPTSQAKSVAQPVNLQKENESLQEELSKIRNSLELISQSSGDNAVVRSLQEMLGLRESELSEARKLRFEREKQLEDITRMDNEKQAEINRLRADLAKQQYQTNGSEKSFEKLIKETVKEATGGDTRFASLVDQLPLDNTLPIALAKHLEQELRELLNLQDRSINLNDLIMQAKDAEALQPDAVSLAHIIRKQRNIVAHGDEYKKTYTARSLISLFAACLLWPEFPE